VRSLRARAWTWWYRARWLLVDRAAMSRRRIRRVAGLDLVVLPGVLDPRVFLSSESLAEAVRRAVPIGGSVLDLGTGCGIGAIVAAEAGAARVVAVDIEAVAVECARRNVARHGLEQRVDVREGDLFEPVEGERFDLVAFNPPYLAARPGSFDAGLERALRAPPDLPERFAARLDSHLVPGGCALLVLSTNGEPESWLGPLRTAAFTASPFMRRDRGSEVLTAWRISQVEAHQPAG
jgi:release factor glutamine methyltransferase